MPGHQPPGQPIDEPNALGFIDGQAVRIPIKQVSTRPRLVPRSGVGGIDRHIGKLLILRAAKEMNLDAAGIKLIDDSIKLPDSLVPQFAGANCDHLVSVIDVILNFRAVAIMHHGNRIQSLVFEIELVAEIERKPLPRIVLVEIEIKVETITKLLQIRSIPRQGHNVGVTLRVVDERIGSRIEDHAADDMPMLEKEICGIPRQTGIGNEQIETLLGIFGMVSKQCPGRNTH